MAGGRRTRSRRPARGRRGTSGRGTPRPAAARACAHKRATGLSSGCYGVALVSCALCFTVDLRRCCRCSADHLLATRQTVTGAVVWSRAGGGKLRRAHGTVGLDGPDEPDEVSLDAQPRDDGSAVTARPARRSAQSGRLVGEFSPQCLVAVQPRLGVWHSRTCGECHTPKSQELRARRCGASSSAKFRMGFRPFVDFSSHLSELRVQQVTQTVLNSV